VRSTNAVQAEYHAQLREGVFALPRCEQCGQTHFYPRALCPFCGSGTLTWGPVSGRGTVYSTTVVRSRSSMYNVALVDLAEGPRMMTRVEGVAPEDVRIGMAVEAAILSGGDTPLVVFTPVDGAAQ
jgi:uncharacterized OB-fold protein